MYKRNRGGWIKHSDFLVLDLLILQLSFILSYVIRHDGGNPYTEPLYRGMASFLVLADISIVFFTEPFKNVLKRGYYQEFKAAFTHAMLIELFASMFLFVGQHGDEYSRWTMALMPVLFVPLNYTARLLWKTCLKKNFKKADRSLLIVTSEVLADEVTKNILQSSHNTFSIAGLILLDASKVGKRINGVDVVASCDEAVEYAQKRWVDEVLINIPDSIPFPKDMANDFVEMGIAVHMSFPEISEIPGKNQIVEKIGGFTVLTTSINYATAGQAFAKRALDIIGGIVGCALTGLLFLFVAPAIYINSPGPIFFSQERIGKNGKKFKIYKFRSMCLDAEARLKEYADMNLMDGDLMFKMEFDPRIIGNKILPDGTRKTGIGQFIRNTSIDEFPQFFNVLKGDMSLVGTRPPLVSEFNSYKLHHRARMAVKPGITGLWQVSGRSKITDFEEVVKLDRKYIEEWSMGLDLRILLQTVKVVFNREGSM